MRAQAVLAPARMMWHILGRKSYVQLYQWVDVSLGGLDKLGTEHGGKIVGASWVALLTLAVALLVWLSKGVKA